MIHEIRAAADYIGSFLSHVEQTASNHNDSSRPVSNEIWREAAETFELIDIWNDVF